MIDDGAHTIMHPLHPIIYSSLYISPTYIHTHTGELDWKVIAINAADPAAKDLNDIGDVETKLPGTISGMLSTTY